MGTRQKPGKKGVTAQYVTRGQAIRKLQITLNTFRKLCILKGIHPRDPPKKKAGKDKIYYHLKDVRFLQYEPLLSKFRDLRAHNKKVRRAIGRKEKSIAKQLQKNAPSFTLHHLVKERYPCVVDAIRDLDDAVSILAIVAALPSGTVSILKASLIKKSAFLLDAFHFYVTQTGALNKSFASIKGYYFTASILDQSVTWLVPHQFCQNLSNSVDYNILITFTEFYTVMVEFCLFKLYSMAGLHFPPAMDKGIDMTSGQFLSFKNLSSCALPLSQEATSNNQSMPPSDRSQLFKGLIFLISREVCLCPSALCILSCGGKVFWEHDGKELSEIEQLSVTHQIVDRPPEYLKNNYENRELVQPQWLFDCVNYGICLPVFDYFPGKVLPPHLSPYVDDVKEGYIPEQREKIDALLRGNDDTEHSSDGKGIENKVEEDASLDAITADELNSRFIGEIQFELNQTIPVTEEIEQEKQAKNKRRDEKQIQERERQKSSMPKKERRLLRLIERREKKKSIAASLLMEKRKKIESKKADKSRS